MKAPKREPGTVERVAVSELREDPQNVRKHSVRNLDAIEASLRRFGQQKPVVAKPDGTVIAGSGQLAVTRDRLKAATIMVQWTALDGHEATAFGIADNRTAELAEWDFHGLADALRAMPPEEWGNTGWQDFEIEPLLAANWEPPKVDGSSSDGTDGQPQHSNLVLSIEQRQVIDAAVEKMRIALQDTKASPGLCVERICQQFLAGA